MNTSAHGTGDAATDLSRRDCYKRIRVWLKEEGDTAVSAEQPQDEHVQRYLSIIAGLPEETVATEADLDWVFGQVLFGSLEYAYHSTDAVGLKMSAYARAGVESSYEGIQDPLFQESARSSELNHS